MSDAHDHWHNPALEVTRTVYLVIPQWDLSAMLTWLRWWFTARQPLHHRACSTSSIEGNLGTLKGRYGRTDDFPARVA
jgi:hypothetical protein